MKIAVTTETSSDLSKELLEQYQIKTIPFGITLGSETFNDGEFSTMKIFDYVKQNKVLPKTNAVNEFQYREFFGRLKNEYDAVVHIALSSGISSACENAKKVAAEMNDVYVVDSKSLSTGVGLLVICASELAQKGETPQNIVKTLETRVPYVQAGFVLDTLEYLYKGGRCSSLAVFGANLLKLHPQILVKDGNMASHKKYRGNMPQVVSKYCHDTLEQFCNPDMSHIFITHSHAPDEQIAAAREVLVDYGFKNIHETIAGSTISSHCGKNCLGILYINDKK